MSTTLGFSTQVVRSFFAVKPRRELRELYGFLTFFSFAASLITIFEPIFFYQLGLPIWRIALFYAAHYTTYIFVLPLGGMFAARFGYERSLTVSAPIFVVYFLLLTQLPQHPSYFWLAVVVLTAFKSLYWPAYHANFAQFTDAKNQGTEQSWVHFVQYGVGILGPILGGIVATLYGFPALFLVAAASVALAGLSLLRTREAYDVVSYRYGDAWRLMKRRRHRSMVVGMVGWGENLIFLAIWPVYMFTVLQQVETVGLFASISAAIATLFGFVAGEMSDRISPRRLLRYVAPIMSLSYIWRIFAFGPARVLIGDVLARTTVVGVDVPFVARLYSEGRRAGVLTYAVAFEMALSITKALVAILLIGLFAWFDVGTAFTLTFGLAALLSLFYAAL